MRKILALLVVGTVAVACSDAGPTGTDGAVLFNHAEGPLVTPIMNPDGNGNPTCSDAGFTGVSFRLNSPPPGTDTIVLPGGFEVEVTITDGGRVLAFESEIVIDGVIIKGGPNANVYDYRPNGTDHDSGLVSPDHPNAGQIPQISHYDFCFQPRLQVSKTAVTGFEREHDWSIEKNGDETEITAVLGSQAVVEYVLDVTYEGYVDAGHSVSGLITVHNPWSESAVVTGVGDSFDGQDGAVTVACYSDAEMENAVSFDYTLDAGGTIYCAYSGDSDGSDGTNTATATTDGTNDIGDGTGTADFAFGDPTTVANECAYVEDLDLGIDPVKVACVEDLTPAQLAGEAISVDSSVIEELSLDVTGLSSVMAAECGAVVQFVNVASVYGGTAEAAGEELDNDSFTVDITVDCTSVGAGCTPGYWMNTRGEWPTPYAKDDLLSATFSGLQPAIGAATFEEALSFGGGPGIAGAQRILMRATVAALLNAASPDVDYPRTEAEIIADVQDAVDSADRDTMLALAAELDEDNNLGCTIDNWGEPISG
jgi:hypothetical protein